MRATSFLAPSAILEVLARHRADIAPYQILEGEWLAIGQLGSMRSGMGQATR
jgi:hypothetical protein